MQRVTESVGMDLNLGAMTYIYLMVQLNITDIVEILGNIWDGGNKIKMEKKSLTHI